MSITFRVNDVSSKISYYRPSTCELSEGYYGLGRFESFGGPEKIIKPETYRGEWQAPRNGLWLAVQSAFLGHRPLNLSPDHIWIQIARVAAEHIVSNAETLRHHFVNFDQKKELDVRRDDFVKGYERNPWPKVFEEFSKQIELHVGPKIRDLFICNFTTTGPVELAASEIVLMDAMSKYFNFSFTTMSGIPEITLLGSMQDWADLKEKAIGLAQYGLEGWVSNVVDFLTQFQMAANGQADLEWWKSFYRERGGSGGDSFDGHLCTLFPTKDLKVPRTVYASSIPHSLSRVPFIWHYLDKEYRMRFCAGVPFAVVDEAGAISPAASWAIEEVK